MKYAEQWYAGWIIALAWAVALVAIIATLGRVQ